MSADNNNGRKVFLISPEAPVAQGEAAGEQRAAASGGLRLGILDNSKSNADHLLAMIIEGVKKQMPVASVISLRKMNPSTPAAVTTHRPTLVIRNDKMMLMLSSQI